MNDFYEKLLARKLAQGDILNNQIIESIAREKEAALANKQKLADEQFLAAKTIENTVQPLSEKLIKHEITWAPEQLEAIKTAMTNRCCAITGAAGTGKTKTLQGLIDTIIHTVKLTDANHDKNLKLSEENKKILHIPSIALTAYTGRAVQMIKKNFPSSWHANAMTIHRLLRVGPEYEKSWNTETKQVEDKRVWKPFYNIINPLPWEIIVIDEAGMCNVELANWVFAAMQPDTKIIMLGDLNQIPPVGGKSIFGFALGAWPKIELTKPQRQKGENNPILEGAWRILSSKLPEFSTPNDTLINIPDNTIAANKIILNHIIQSAKDKKYHPNNSTILTCMNGLESHAPAYHISQTYLNSQMSQIFNKKNPAIAVDGGIFKLEFRVGDKIMATANDYEKKITNGITGKIVSITKNADYEGKSYLYGTKEEIATHVKEYLSDEVFIANINARIEEAEQKSDNWIQKQLENQNAPRENEIGLSSHTITCVFDKGLETETTVEFKTKNQVGSLARAYVTTYHKSQGGEYENVFLIAHPAFSVMQSMELMYTGWTRAKKNVTVFSSKTNLIKTISTKRIKGKTLEEKIASYQKSQEGPLANKKISQISRLPNNYKTGE